MQVVIVHNHAKPRGHELVLVSTDLDTPAPNPAVAAEERERRYREALGIPEEKRRRWGRR